MPTFNTRGEYEAYLRSQKDKEDQMELPLDQDQQQGQVEETEQEIVGDDLVIDPNP